MNIERATNRDSPEENFYKSEIKAWFITVILSLLERILICLFFFQVEQMGREKRSITTEEDQGQEDQDQEDQDQEDQDQENQKRLKCFGLGFFVPGLWLLC